MEAFEKIQTKEAYDNNAEALAARYKSINISRKEDVDRAFELLGPKDNPRVLELGSGNGRETADILRHTQNYLGVDFSTGMVKIARAVNPAAKFEVADIADYDFPKGLDVIFAFASLLHLDKKEVRGVFSRAADALNPGGIFYISIKKGPYHHEMKTNEYGTRHFYYYESENIAELAGPGFEVVETDTQTVEGTPWLTVVLRRI